MRALRDFNLPKIVDDDKVIYLMLIFPLVIFHFLDLNLLFYWFFLIIFQVIFKRIISDLFPGLELAPKVDHKFIEWVRQCTLRNKLQAEDSFVGKVFKVGSKKLGAESWE